MPPQLTIAAAEAGSWGSKCKDSRGPARVLSWKHARRCHNHSTSLPLKLEAPSTHLRPQAKVQAFWSREHPCQSRCLSIMTGGMLQQHKTITMNSEGPQPYCNPERTAKTHESSVTVPQLPAVHSCGTLGYIHAWCQKHTKNWSGPTTMAWTPRLSAGCCLWGYERSPKNIAWEVQEKLSLNLIKRV